MAEESVDRASTDIDFLMTPHRQIQQEMHFMDFHAKALRNSSRGGVLQPQRGLEVVEYCKYFVSNQTTEYLMDDRNPQLSVSEFEFR